MKFAGNRFIDDRARKISETMRRKSIDNFAQWRERARQVGKIPMDYPAFEHNGDLAELIGVTLGDGHIEKFPRAERLVITGNANNAGFIQRYSNIVERIFRKKVRRMKSKQENAIRISVYQKHISDRMRIPSGSRKHSTKGVPDWIFRDKKLLVRCFRGLYEAEGSFTVHLPTHTYKAEFSNKNRTLLHDVHKGLQILGFSPLYERYRIMISRKEEFFALKRLLCFRDYRINCRVI